MINYIIILVLIILVVYLFFNNKKGEHFESSKEINIPDNIPDNMDDLLITFINLKKDVERKKKMEEKLNKHNLKYEITEAVNGYELDIDKLIKENIIKITEEKLKRGQYGVYLSHINIWKKLIESDKKYCLVLEDDVDFVDNFRQKINFMVHELNNLDLSNPNNNIDMIYLIPEMSCNHFFKEEDCKKSYDAPNLTNVRKPINIGYGMYGYIITKQGAEKLLKLSLPMTLPIDVLTHHLNYTNTINICKTIIPYINHIGEYSNTQSIV
jgi:glycosyl transferase family 25